MNKDDAVKLMIALDRELFLEKKHGDKAKELKAQIIEYMGENEELDLGAFILRHPYIDAVGKINEDKLRADFPDLYQKYATIKIDAKKLRDGDPHAYNECLISGEAQRRFTYKTDAAKLARLIEKLTKEELEGDTD